MSIFTAIGAATVAVLAVPLDDGQRNDIRCVAVLAVVAYEQPRGGWPTLPRLDARAREYAAIVGARTMDEARADRDQVARMFQAEAARLARAPATVAEARTCLTRMEVELADAPLPPPLR